MQFIKKTSTGKVTAIGKFLTKFFLLVFVLFLGLIFISKIDFPAPSKKIEKIIPNENFKKIK
tara:strand:- start:950 stop:1135 length:186 start_codon:yes stop_codon:yes gene_type:complete